VWLKMKAKSGNNFVALDLECNFLMQDICLIYGTRHLKEAV